MRMSGRHAATANQNGVSKATRSCVTLSTTSAETLTFGSSRGTAGPNSETTSESSSVDVTPGS